MVRIAPRMGTLALATVLLGLMPSVAVAQDSSPAADMATHPIIGVWKSAPDPGTDVFHADGTFVSITSDAVIAGVWEPSGPRSATITVWFPSPEGSQVSLRGGVDVSEDGMGRCPARPSRLRVQRRSRTRGTRGRR